MSLFFESCFLYSNDPDCLGRPGERMGEVEENPNEGFTFSLIGEVLVGLHCAVGVWEQEAY